MLSADVQVPESPDRPIVDIWINVDPTHAYDLAETGRCRPEAFTITIEPVLAGRPLAHRPLQEGVILSSSLFDEQR